MTPGMFAISHFLVCLETNQNYLDWFKRLGNLGVFAGAISVSFSASWSATIWPFIFYTVGNLIWVIVAWRFLRDRPLVEMNLFFLCINIYGMFVRL